MLTLCSRCPFGTWSKLELNDMFNGIPPQHLHLTGPALCSKFCQVHLSESHVCPSARQRHELNTSQLVQCVLHCGARHSPAMAMPLRRYVRASVQREPCYPARLTYTP